MDLSLTETQLMLRDSARRYFTGALPNDRRLAIERSASGHDADMWKAMADMGWQGLLVPEKYGGVARPLGEMGTLLHEMGRTCLPSPFFESAVLCSLILMEGATEDQKAALLPALASGEKIMALALTEANYGWTADKVQLPAVRKNGRYSLSGTKMFAPWANVANQLLVVARTKQSDDPEDGLTIFLVDADATGVDARVLSGWLEWRWTELTLNKVEAPRASIIGEVNGAWPILAAAFEKAVPLLCCVDVGLCEAVFELVVGYSRTRIQFGQPIGAFQRVADMIIEIVNRLDGARWLTADAIWRLETGEVEAAEAASAAKAFTSEAVMIATSWAHRMTGGTGVQVDYGLPSYSGLARSIYTYLGDTKHHKRQLAKLLQL